MLHITTLMDDQTSHKNMKAEHGLSYLVEYNNSRYLFDTGSTGLFLENAYKLGAKLDKLDGVILSHSHYDHSCGFKFLIDSGICVNELYTGQNFFKLKYSQNGVKVTNLSCGFDKEFLDKNNINHHVVNFITELCSGFYLVTGFEKLNSFETIPSRFVKLGDNGFVKDDFSDEIVAVLETDKGLVVLSGCAHVGILNICEHIYSIFNKPLYAIFGGTHLVEADDVRIKETVAKLKRMGVNILGLSHCTGIVAEGLIAKDEDICSCHLGVGDEILIQS